MNKNFEDPFVKKATLTASGRPWVQRCFICLRSIDFIKDSTAVKWIRVGEFVRHRKCNPGMPK